MKLRMLFGPDALSTGSIGLLPRLKYLKNMRGAGLSSLLK